jgi:hypothetical protein
MRAGTNPMSTEVQHEEETERNEEHGKLEYEKKQISEVRG